MIWKNPPVIKIYEALGVLADGRLIYAEIGSLREDSDKEWRVYSSSGNKFYNVKYDADKNAIMTNDDGSYWQGYLGYPAIAFLMSIGRIKYQQKFAKALKGVKWKDVNTKFKNDYNKTIEYCHELIVESGYDLEEFLREIGSIERQIKKLKMEKLGKRMRPPRGY